MLLRTANDSSFNPRSHERSDFAACHKQRVVLVSIHAPTRGATTRLLHLPVSYSCFNPRSHERSDTLILSFAWTNMSFNPRSHERSDTLLLLRFPLLPLFQSTLPREERHHVDGLGEAEGLVSIHAPTRGATGSRVQACATSHVSIHAPTRGATTLSLKAIPIWLMFQSTLPREERRF